MEQKQHSTIIFTKYDNKNGMRKYFQMMDNNLGWKHIFRFSINSENLHITRQSTGKQTKLLIEHIN
jgi:hypothetical protein